MLFSHRSSIFKDSTKNHCIKNDSRHGRFRRQVVMRVDETVFSVLYVKRVKVPPTLPWGVGGDDDSERGSGAGATSIVREPQFQPFGVQCPGIDDPRGPRADTFDPLACSDKTRWDMPGSTVKTCSRPVRLRSPGTGCRSSTSVAGRCARTASPSVATLPGTPVTS